MIRKLYLIWRIWATSHNVRRKEAWAAQSLLDNYYTELEAIEYPEKVDV